MNLALYPSRVRSNDLLDGNCDGSNIGERNHVNYHSNYLQEANCRSSADAKPVDHRDYRGARGQQRNRPKDVVGAVSTLANLVQTYK